MQQQLRQTVDSTDSSSARGVATDPWSDGKTPDPWMVGWQAKLEPPKSSNPFLAVKTNPEATPGARQTAESAPTVRGPAYHDIREKQKAPTPTPPTPSTPPSRAPIQPTGTPPPPGVPPPPVTVRPVRPPEAPTAPVQYSTDSSSARGVATDPWSDGKTPDPWMVGWQAKLEPSVAARTKQFVRGDPVHAHWLDVWYPAHVLEVTSGDVVVYWTDDRSISTLPKRDVTRSFDCLPIDPKELPLLSAELVAASKIATASTASVTGDGFGVGHKCRNSPMTTPRPMWDSPAGPPVALCQGGVTDPARNFEGSPIDPKDLPLPPSNEVRAASAVENEL